MNVVDPRISDIPEEYYIYDYRKLSDFKKITYSGYQKTDVLSALQKSIIDNKVEEACHWCTEMLVSGHV
jgi:replication-associated recombination protein RarA